MRTRSGKRYIEEIEQEQERERINTLFRQWKNDINSTFYRLTSFNLEDIPDLPYYYYFSRGVDKDIVVEIALNNIF